MEKGNDGIMAIQSSQAGQGPVLKTAIQRKSQIRSFGRAILASALTLVSIIGTLVVGASSASATWIGWGEVPGGGRTSDTPAAVTTGTVEWVFVRGTDERIHFNRFYGNSWSGWDEVPGGGRTPSAPGAVAISPEGHIYLFVRGTDSGIYLNRFNGSDWSGWGEIAGGGRTPSEPTATAKGGLLYLSVRGTDNGIHFNRFNGSDWSGWNEVPGGRRTPSAPGITIALSSILLFHRDNDNRINFNRFDGSSWSGWSEVPGGGRTFASPNASALAVGTPQYIYVGVRGTDNGVYFNKLFEGDRTWSGWQPVPGRSSYSAPGANFYSNRISFFISSDGRIWRNRDV